MHDVDDQPARGDAAARRERSAPPGTPRTLGAALLGLASGIAAGPAPWLAAALLIASGVVLLRSRRQQRSPRFAAVAVLAAFLAAGLALSPVAPHASAQRGLVTRLGRVRQRSDRPHPATPPDEQRGSLDLVVEDPSGRVTRVFFDGAPPDVWPGDRVRVTGALVPPPAADNPAALDPARQLLLAGVDEQISAGPSANVALLARGGPSLRRATAELRAELLAILDHALDPEDAALACALLVGQPHGMSEETIAVYRDTGTLHFLAVSGMHLTLLLVLLRHLLLDARSERGWVRAAQLALVILYMGLTDFTPSVMRAGTLAICIVGSSVCRRRTKLWDCVCASALALLLIEPRELFVVGFQLSLAATAAIVLLQRPIERLLTPHHQLEVVRVRGLTRTGSALRKLRASLSVSIAASLATWPLCAHHFGAIVPLAPLMSLLVVPFITVLMLSFLLLVPWSALALPGHALLADACHAVARWSLDWLHVLDALPGTPQIEPVVPIAALAAALLAAWCFAGRRIAAALACAAASAAALWLLGPTPPAKPRVVTLSVGHGLAVLFQSPQATWLYDAGSGSRRDVGRRTIVPALRALGVRRLDLLAISHFDADHVNGIEGLIDAYPPAVCLLPGGTDRRPFVGRLLASLAQHGVTLLAPGDAEWPSAVGPFSLAFSAARTPTPQVSNDESLVVRVQVGGWSVLLTGDIEQGGVERALADGIAGPADVLLVPHHGMHCRGLPRLVRSVRPALQIVSGEPQGNDRSRTGTLPTHALGAIFLQGDDRGLAAWSFLQRREVARIPR